MDLQVSMAANLPPVHGDTAALRLILRNLVECCAMASASTSAWMCRRYLRRRARDWCTQWPRRSYQGDAATLGSMFTRR